MSDTMWVVSKGEYSDYRVMCICPTKRDAKKVAERFNGGSSGGYDGARVESLPVVTGDVQRVSVIHLSIEVLDDGTVEAHHESTRAEWPFDALYGTPKVHTRWVRAPYIARRGGRLEVHGTDHERVRRVYSDTLATLRSDDALRARVEFNRGGGAS